MWQSLVTIGPEISKIKRRIKKSKRIETSAVKYNGRRPASWRAAIIIITSRTKTKIKEDKVDNEENRERGGGKNKQR